MKQKYNKHKSLDNRQLINAETTSDYMQIMYIPNKI